MVDRRDGAGAVTDPARPTGGIDVDRLMDDLKRRVEARRAAGEIDQRVLDMPFTAETDVDATSASVRLRPETAYSSKPGLGRVITIAKRAQIRFIFHFLNDLVSQINAALRRLDDRQGDTERARRRLEEQVVRNEEELAGLRRRVAALESAAGASPEG
jgi:hypothetical protein